MNQIDEETMKHILASSKLTFQDRSFIYTFTNENVKEYLKNCSLQDKDILTVVGSGDHILNMLLSTTYLDAFDINLYAYYFYVLKKYALAALELDEYLEFFLDKEVSYNLKVFNKIKQSWHDELEIKEFFDELFKHPYLKHTSLFVNNKWTDREKLISQNEYLEEQNYYQLKKTILEKSVHFIHSNLTKIELNQSYDFIFISNITDYLNNMFQKTPLRSYKKMLYQRIIPYLKENGQLISYLYDGKIVGYLKSEVSEVLKYGFTEKEVEKDRVLIYTKGGLWKNT